MKTLKNWIYALIALVAIAGTACTEDKTEGPAPKDLLDCYLVYFPNQNNTGTIELDPSDPTTFTYRVLRENIYDAITVPVEIVGGEGWQVSPIEFADGDDVTNFTVTMPEDTEIGVTYTIEINITDPQYASIYSAVGNTSLKLNVTRMKWIDLGEVDYTDDIIRSMWAITSIEEHPTFKVKAQVREDSIKDMDAFNAARAGQGSDEDLGGLYRLIDTYDSGPYKGWGSFSPAYFVIDARNPNMITFPYQQLGIEVNGIEQAVWSYADYYIEAGNPNGAEGYYGYIQNGSILFPPNSILEEPEGTGQLYAVGGEFFRVNIAPALNQYELALPDPVKGNDGDFKFTKLSLPDNAFFYSEAFGTMHKQTLEVGVPTVNTDNADARFNEQYGTLYRLPNLYATGYHVYFCVKNGAVSVPSAFELQDLGLFELGSNLAMFINGSKSKFDLNGTEPRSCDIELSVEITDFSGEKSFGTFTEVLSTTAPEFEVKSNLDLARDFNYTTLFSDEFDSKFNGAKWTVDFQKGTPKDKSEGEIFEQLYGTAYCVPSAYAKGFNIYFTGKDGEVSVPDGYDVQPTGFSTMGHTIYAHILSGSVSDYGAMLRVQFVDESGNVFGTFNESIITYNWVDLSTATYNTLMFVQPIRGVRFQWAEGTNFYRLYNFLGTGANLEIMWDGGSKYEFTGPVNTGMEYDAPGSYMWIADARSYFNDYAGNNYTWAFLESADYPQPTYNSVTNTFTQYTNWYIPTEQLATGFGFETIVLDSPLTVATWEQVATGEFHHGIEMWGNQSGVVVDETLPLERYGDTNRYRVADLAGGMFNLEFTHDPSSGMIIVSANDTGYVEQGYGNLYLCDAYSAYTFWGVGITPEEAYTEENAWNSYDAASQTYTFNLVYCLPGGYYMGPDDSDSMCAPFTYKITNRVSGASVPAQTEKCHLIPFSSVQHLANIPSNIGKSNGVAAGKMKAMKDKPANAKYTAKSVGGIYNAVPVEFRKSEGAVTPTERKANSQRVDRN